MFSAVRHYDIMQFHVIVLCAFIFISIISVFTCDSIYAIARVNITRLSVRPSHGCIIEQESCAIAKMTARCALYK